MDKKRKVVIIGGCIAAKEAAKAIRNVDSLCSITMISSEDCLPYYRTMLSNAIGKEIPTSRFCLAPEEWYAENNIQLLLNTTATQILPEENVVIADNGYRYDYTHLLIATGANNFIPLPEAMSKKGVFSIRTYKDVLNLRDYLPDIKNAIVVGGGLLGLEAAWELHQQNIHVTLIEFAPHILPKQLDKEASEFLTLYLQEKGLTISCANSVQNVLGGKCIEGVECSNGETLVSDLLIFSIGARPNIELVKGTSIVTDVGIVVNNYMQTNIPNIYAAGDVAQNPYRTSGVWVPAMEMGAVAGCNIAGKHSEYNPSHIPAMLTTFGIKVFSVGNISDDPSLVTETIVDSEKNTFKKLFLKDNLLVGAILMGDVSKGVKLAKQMNLITLQEAKKIVG